MLYIEDLDFDFVREIQITLKQENRKLTKDAVIDAENKSVYIDLTQEDTLQFKVGTVKIQAKIKLMDGGVDATNIVDEPTTEILDRRTM